MTIGHRAEAVALVGVAGYLLARRQTLSHETRRSFRTDTGPGRAVFTVALVAGAVWFWRHIVGVRTLH